MSMARQTVSTDICYIKALCLRVCLRVCLATPRDRRAWPRVQRIIRDRATDARSKLDQTIRSNRQLFTITLSH